MESADGMVTGSRRGEKNIVQRKNKRDPCAILRGCLIVLRDAEGLAFDGAEPQLVSDHR
jgi:hypothetical protein